MVIYWQRDDNKELREAQFDDLVEFPLGCGNRSPNGRWICNRPKRHTGPHEGMWHGDKKYSCGVWKNEDEIDTIRAWWNNCPIERRGSGNRADIPEISRYLRKDWDELPILLQIKILRKISFRY